MVQSGGRGNAVRAVNGAVTLAQPAAPAVASVALLILSPWPLWRTSRCSSLVVSSSLPRRAFSSQVTDNAGANSRNGSPQQQAVSASVESESPAASAVSSASSSSAPPTPAANASVSPPAAPTAYPRRRASHPAPLDNSWGQATAANLSSGTKFALTKNFIDKWRHKTPPFGYNGLGELVYRRTYSRKLHEQPDGSPQGANEQWFETVERVVNGTYNMQKQWIEQHELGWNAWKAQKSAQEMFERIFTMKFLPPGRGLWAMGSPITETRGLFAALNNCLTMDTQVLTASGFLFHDEIAARLAAGQPVEAACYDATLKQLCYRPISASDVIYKEIDTAAHPGDVQHQIVDLVRSDKSARGLHAELSVTADHDVYVQFSSESKREQLPFRKMQARELFQAEHQAAAREVHVLTHAANGAERSQQAEPSCFQRLGLATEDQKMAFLELYGFWVGEGSLRSGAVSFAPTQEKDAAYLRSLFARLPLRQVPAVEGGDSEAPVRREGFLEDQTRFCIFEASWADYFAAECGQKVADADAQIVEAEDVKGATALSDWVFKCLDKEQLRAIVRGLGSADGNESSGHISTSSVSLRDDLQRLLLHAGFTSSFSLADGKQDQWRVSFSDEEQSTTTHFQCTTEVKKREDYKGGVWCIRVPTVDRLIVVRKADRDAAGVVTSASRPCIVGNCAFVSTEGMDSDQDKSKPFTFLMDASMLGVGVGFDTKGAGKLPIKGAQNTGAPRTFVIPDSREGWVEALRLLLNSYIHGREAVAFDYGQIRPFGTPIRGFGGVASGPSALMELLESVRKLMEARVGAHLTATDITDIMNLIGRCVVAGNVRRCLPGDALVHTRDGLIPIRGVQRGQEVLTFTGQFRRVVDHVVQGEQGLVKIVTAHSEFRCTPTHRMAVLQGKDGAYVWKRADQLAAGDNLISPRTPIPGSVTRLPAWSNPTPPPPSVPGAPIEVPELDAAMAWLMGLFQSNGRADPDHAQDGENAHVQLQCADSAVAAKAAAQLQRFGADLIVETQQGTVVRCQSKQLASYFHEHVTQPTSLRVPSWIASSTLANRQAFIAGVLDSRTDRAAEEGSAGLLSTADAEYALDVQRLLYSCGVESRAELCRDAASPRASSLTLFTEYAAQVVSAFPELVQPRTWKLDSESAVAGGAHANFLAVPVLRVEPSGREDTFDISVEGEHEFFVNGLLSHNTAEIAFGDPDSDEYLDLKNYEKNPSRAEFGWTSNNSVFARLGMDYKKVCDRVRANGEPGFAWLENMQQYARMNGVRDDRDHRVKGGNPCLEQSLESYELCCLVETFPTNHESYEDFQRTLKYAYLYAKTVTLGKTHWPETNRVMLRNRRIGCSVSGVAQFISQRSLHELKGWLEQGYDAIQRYDKDYSDWFAIPRSIKTTSVKPSGTVSLLAGATPGMHYPESRFYIRRMRLSAASELVKPLIEAGYPIEPAADGGAGSNTVVVEIPVDVGAGVRTASQVPMWEQLSLAAFLQRYWADNQVSCTVTFDPETEGPQLEQALDYFQYQLKGISFLPKLKLGAFAQMPYEAIDQGEYERRLNALKPLHFADARVRNEEANPDRFCDGDLCSVDGGPTAGTGEAVSVDSVSVDQTIDTKPHPHGQQS